MRSLAVVVLVLTVCLPGSVYAASPRDVARAEALFRSGRDKLERGDPKGACADFVASQKLDPTLGTLLNLAICSEQLGQLRRARSFWELSLPRLPRGDERRAPGEKALSSLKARIPKLTVMLESGAPDGTRVFRDGEEMSRTNLGRPFEVDPGRVIFRVEAPGNDPVARALTVGEGTATVVALSWKSAPPAPPLASSAPTWAYVAAVAGGAVIATGVGFGVDALAAKDEAKGTDPARAQAASARQSSSESIAVGLGAVGLLTLGVAAYGLLSEDALDTEGRSATPRRGEIRPVAIGPSRVGLGVWF